MSGIAFHPGALADLDEIWEFIAKDSVEAADRVVDDILTAAERMQVFPYSGYIRFDLTSKPLRFARVHDFLICYAPDERPLWIIAVLHGRRNPRVMAAVLRDRE